jgi:large subunit ribosomal protein L7A
MAIIMLSEVQSRGRLVGLKQSKRAIQEGKALKAFIAEDSAETIRQTVADLCEKHGVAVEYAASMKQLGEACGIDVGSSVVVITGR